MSFLPSKIRLNDFHQFSLTNPHEKLKKNITFYITVKIGKNATGNSSETRPIV